MNRLGWSNRNFLSRGVKSVNYLILTVVCGGLHSPSAFLFFCLFSRLLANSKLRETWQIFLYGERLLTHVNCKWQFEMIYLCHC